MTSAAATFFVAVMMSAATTFFVVVMMSAAATFFVVVMMSAAATFFVVAAASATIIAAASAATLAGEHSERAFNFGIGGITFGDHFTNEVEVFAGKTFVEVNDHHFLFHLDNESDKTVSVGIDQRKFCAGIDHLIVKVTVHAENVFGQFDHMRFIVGTVSLILRQDEIKRFAFSHLVNVFLESVKCDAQTGDKLIGVFLRSTFDQFVHSFFIVGVETICHSDIFMSHIFHWSILIIMIYDMFF